MPSQELEAVSQGIDIYLKEWDEHIMPSDEKRRGEVLKKAAEIGRARCAMNAAFTPLRQSPSKS